MKGFSAVVLSSVLGCFAFAQQMPILAAAKPIDVRVDRMDWHPFGSTLLYSRAEEGGVGVGLFQVGDIEGKLLLHLKASDTWEAQWLEGQPMALVVVHRTVSTGQGDQNEAAVYLLNAKLKACAEVFSKITPLTEKVSIGVDTSPSLLHAIFEITIGKETHHYVLPNNGGQLVASRDIDEAVRQGNSGPSWSQDGTAIYGGVDKPGVFTLKSGNQNISLGTAVTAASGDITDFVGKEIRLSLAAADAKGLLLGDGNVITLKLVPPSPPVGASVLEVVPSNGVIRPVRFKGPWQDQPGKEPLLDTKSKLATLTFGNSRGNANGLWLTFGKEAASQAVLVAAHAGNASIAPGERAVAYTIDGALFVREINPK